MKTLQSKLALIIFLLITYTNYCNISNLDIAKKMQNDEKVISLLKNKIKLNLIKIIENSNNTSDYKSITEIKNSVLKENIIYNEYIENTYPEYELLDKENKKVIISQILENSPAMISVVECVGDKIAIFVSTSLLVGASDAAILYCKGCIFASLAADIIADIETGGANAAATVPEVTTEVSFCKWLVRGTFALGGASIYELVNELLRCVPSGEGRN